MLMTLRGAVLSKYRTAGEFAKAVNWSRGKAGRVMRGEQDIDIDDIIRIADALDINDVATFNSIFFPTLSTKWTGKSNA